MLSNVLVKCIYPLLFLSLTHIHTPTCTSLHTQIEPCIRRHLLNLCTGIISDSDLKHRQICASAPGRQEAWDLPLTRARRPFIHICVDPVNKVPP